MSSYSRAQSRGLERLRPAFTAPSHGEQRRARLTFPTALMLVFTLALILLAPVDALWAQEGSAERLPSPMSGIEVSESQRTAMRASWALVAGEWDAILERSRARGTVSAEDSRTLSRLASEHNERLLGIFTPAQRERLEGNLEALRREQERRASGSLGARRTPPLNEGDTMGAREEVHS